MDFRVREGPWKTIFKGELEGYEIEILTNPESFLLIMVLEKKEEKIEGAVIEVFNVFSVEGELEDFIETFPKEAMIIEKHEKNSTVKYLLLSSSPSYTKFEENAFCNEAEKLMENLKNLSKTVKDISKAYDLEIVPLHKSGEKEKNEFFSSPVIMPLIAPRTPREEREAVKTFEVKGEVILGLSSQGKLIEEPLKVFKRTTVFGNEKKQINHVFHLLIEGALVNHVPAVIFDWDKSFNGLNKPNNDLEALRKAKLEFAPIGFPIREFEAKELKVDLELVDPEALLDLFGVMGKEETEIIKKAFNEIKAQSIKEIVELIEKKFSSEEIKPAIKYRTIRILNLINNRYPELFGGKNNIEEIAKKWGKTLGRAGIIHMEGLSERKYLLIIHNVLNGILNIRGKEKTRAINAMVFLPEAKKIIPAEKRYLIEEKILETLQKCAENGIYYAVNAQKPIDLSEKIRGTGTEIFVIEGNDVGIRTEGKKQFRLRLRPGLSMCSEK